MSITSLCLWSSDSCNEDDSFNAPSNLNLGHEDDTFRPETTLQNFGNCLLIDESFHEKLKQSNDDDEKEKNQSEYSLQNKIQMAFCAEIKQNRNQ